MTKPQQPEPVIGGMSGDSSTSPAAAAAAIRATFGATTEMVKVPAEAYEQAITLLSDSLRNVYKQLVYGRSGGDETCATLLAEDWPVLVPAEVRNLLRLGEDE